LTDFAEGLKEFRRDVKWVWHIFVASPKKWII